MMLIKRFDFSIILISALLLGMAFSSFPQQSSAPNTPQGDMILNDEDAALIYTEEDGAEPESQSKPEPEEMPQLGGYLTNGVSTYGVQEHVVAEESPLLELKNLRKKYFLELKRKSVLEEENRVLHERLYSFEKMVREKENDFNAMQRRAIDAEFRYVALGQKLTNFRMAILRKKMLRESQYPIWYEVKKNDSLWRIAGRKQIYDNNLKWIELYYANQDKIADPDFIYPGMVLKISRPTLEYEDWTVEGLELDKLKEKMGIQSVADFDSNDLSNRYNDNMVYPIVHRTEKDNGSVRTGKSPDNDGASLGNKNE